MILGRVSLVAFVLGAVLVFGMAPEASAEGSLADKNPSRPLFPLVVATAAGTVTLQVEIARTPREQQLGLMHRQSMPADQGMIFLHPRPTRLGMWMKNTLIALDMLFIDQFSTIRHIHSPAIPHDETVITSPAASVAVLELNAGTARRLGIREGDKVRLSVP